MPEEKFRRLTNAEILLAKSVFWNTLPYDKVWIGDDTGYGGRPWVEVEGWLEPDAYTIHFGHLGYRDATSDIHLMHDDDPARYTFIHELTHVWQAYQENKWVLTRSASRSICYDTVNIGISAYNMAKNFIGEEETVQKLDMYDYQTGLQWDEYNVEQQAKIVEHWYSGYLMETGKYGAAMSPESELYRYVRDNIRTGRVDKSGEKVIYNKISSLGSS